MLAILDLTFVASLSGEGLLKGLLAGGIGLFLSTVGLCQMLLSEVGGGKRFLVRLGYDGRLIMFVDLPEDHLDLLEREVLSRKSFSC